MSVLSDRRIIDELVAGRVVCRPLRRENIRGSSIDLTIGESFWRCDANPNGIFNPYDRREVERYFAGPFQAKQYASVWEKIGRDDPRGHEWPPPGDNSSRGGNHYCYGMQDHPFDGIPEDWPVIVLRPRERILAHTHEFVGAHPPFTTELRARSSMGRVGLTVALCAGWGDPGYINRWTMEVANLNDEAIIIPVGERVAQIIIHECGETREHYGTERLYESKYQQHAELDEVIASWTPQAMLPRNWKDVRVPLASLDADEYAHDIEALRALVSS